MPTKGALIAMLAVDLVIAVGGFVNDRADIGWFFGFCGIVGLYFLFAGEHRR